MKTLLRLTFCALFAVCLLASGALAEKQAEDMTSRCSFFSGVNEKKFKNFRGENYRTYWDGGEKGSLRVKCPAGKKAQGIMLTVFRDVPKLTVEGANGRVLAEYTSRYVSSYIPFEEPASSFTIRYDGGGIPVKISRLRVLSEGTLPDWVQLWEEPDNDMDLMLVSTHADDDILWFGGLLPTYAGEQKKKVIVIYMVGGANGMRMAELLDGLWTMGVHTYPDIGSFPDITGPNLQTARAHWGGDDAAPLRITRAIRKYRPKVIFTQAMNGEYGHYHHIVTVEATVDAVTKLAADPDYDPDSVAEHGVHQVQKLYLYLWKEGVVRYNWRKPLSAFGGKTGLQVARAAFKKHPPSRPPATGCTTAAGWTAASSDSTSQPSGRTK